MKSALKIVSLALIVSMVAPSCKKNDDGPIIPVNLSSVKYSPNKLDGKQKTAFSGKNAIVSPKNASVTFEISKVTKDKKNFANPKSGGFMIDTKGKISAPKDHKLDAGTYILTITTTEKKGKKTKGGKTISKKTTFTVVISKPATSKLISIGYTPNKLTGKQKVAIKSANATIEPKNASVTFTILGIRKDKKKFQNPKSGGFKIGSEGNISLPKDHELSAGTYVLKIVAADKKDEKNKKGTRVTVVVK